ncbi:MAG: alpha/beta hydrolase [Mesorhizobium sp.]
MPSFKSHLIAFVLKHTRKKAFRSVEGLHARIAKMRKVEDYRPGAAIEARLAITERSIADCPVYEAKPKSGEVRQRILYLHGGAYCFEMTPFHWNLIALLCEELGAHVTVPIYPLAPENKFDRIYGAMTEIYRDAVTEDGTVTVMGDSAGGNMALVLSLMAADQGWPRPKRLLLISPGVDMTLANPQTRDYARRDPWLDIDGGRESVRLYAGDMDFADWRISPLYGDLKQLPPFLVFTGTRDMLHPDTKVFADKARQAGVAADIVIGDGMIHVWPLIDMPEALVARRQILDYLRG